MDKVIFVQRWNYIFQNDFEGTFQKLILLLLGFEEENLDIVDPKERAKRNQLRYYYRHKEERLRYQNEYDKKRYSRA